MNEKMLTQISSREDQFSFRDDEVYFYNAHQPMRILNLFKQRYDNFDEKKVREIFERSLGVSDIQEITLNESRGQGHVIAFVKTADKTYVYRQTFGLTGPEPYMLFEDKIAEKYKEIGIGGPNILMSGSEPKSFDKLGFEWQIMEVLPGKNLKEVPCTQAEYDGISLEIGKITAMQYHIPMEGRGRIKEVNGKLKGCKKTHHDHLTAYLGYDLGVMDISKIVDHVSVSLLENHLFGEYTQKLFANTKGFLVHNDLPDHNVRVDEKLKTLLAIYDLENNVIWDPIDPLGSLPTWKFPTIEGRNEFFNKKAKLKEGFLKYIQDKGLDSVVDISSLDEKIAVYFLRAILRKIPLAIKENRLSQRHIELFEQALRDSKLDNKIKTNFDAIQNLVAIDDR